MSLKKLPCELEICKRNDMIRLAVGDVETGWISPDDTFVERISEDNINPFYRINHLTREIEIKNTLDKAVELLNAEKFSKSIAYLDEVLYYDDSYPEALINKSHALFGEGHFVKSLRFYKKAIKSGFPQDIEYHRLLLRKSSEERDSFPKIKRNIYAGDEAVAKGEFERALEFYENALKNPSKFKNKILFKLLNKRGFVLIKLERFKEALATFDESIESHKNDVAIFARGYCKYELGWDCRDDLRMAIEIDKRQLFCKAMIFNKIEDYNDGLNAFNEFLNNHFRMDSSFKSAIEGKAVALENLNMDSAFERQILSQIVL